jgi:hypothetical protein
VLSDSTASTASSLLDSAAPSDGFECGGCKTAKTNILRLSGGLRSGGVANARVAVVDCEEVESAKLCYEHQLIPSAPHAPVVKMWKSGAKRTPAER